MALTMTIGWNSKRPSASLDYSPMPGDEKPPGRATSLQREFHFTQSDFAFLVEFLKENTGISMSKNKADMVYARLARRIRALGLPSFAAYIDVLNGCEGETERGHLVNALTTNLTRFFRESHHFEHLQNVALVDTFNHVRDAGKDRVRLWSAGCASGEEAYSIAMILHAQLRDKRGLDAKILATDMDTNVLGVAAEGQYSAEALETVPPEMRSRCATQTRAEGGMDWRIRDNIRSLVTFKRLNLIRDWPMRGPFDVIFCRNVMIYFDKDTTKRLLHRFTEILRPGGWLYVGHSENIIGMDDRLQRVAGTTYRRVDK